jgi:hypothetical protein
MKFKVTKIAAAVAAGLGVSMVGMNAAQADTILFPHFVMSPTVTTILSVMNGDYTKFTGDELHYRYYFKDVSAAASSTPPNARQCEEYDIWNPTSPNDIVTFDISAHFDVDDQGVLFEPASANAKNVTYVDDFAQLGRTQPVSPTRGYLLVDNTTRDGLILNPEVQLSGEAIVIEFTTGSAWGYNAFNPSEIWGFTPGIGAAPGTLNLLNPNDFSDRVEVNGEVLIAPRTTTFAGLPPVPTIAEQQANFWVPVSITPWDEIDSALLVTAVSTNMGTRESYNGSTALQLRAGPQGADGIMFNRDERAYSGPGGAGVTCVGRIEFADLVGLTVQQATPQGGWTNLVISSGQAIVFKAEINTSLPVDTGTFNNIYQLRKGIRESLGRPLATAGWNYLPVFNIPGIDNNAPFAPWNGATSVPLAGTSNGNPVVNTAVTYNQPTDAQGKPNPNTYASSAAVQRAVDAGNVTGSTVQ